VVDTAEAVPATITTTNRAQSRAFERDGGGFERGRPLGHRRRRRLRSVRVDLRVPPGSRSAETGSGASLQSTRYRVST
jgi:hypothetical protein